MDSSQNLARPNLFTPKRGLSTVSYNFCCRCPIEVILYQNDPHWVSYLQKKFGVNPSSFGIGFTRFGKTQRICLISGQFWKTGDCLKIHRAFSRHQNNLKILGYVLQCLRNSSVKFQVNPSPLGTGSTRFCARYTSCPVMQKPDLCPLKCP